ncbi:MAG: glucose-6-phosphate isomerase [Rhodospirillaceae bacterium]|nr:glucose-6-phosphate isomerase [Rhodospirillaceae bacterium]
MLYEHRTHHCFAAAIGDGGLTEPTYRLLIEDAAPAIQQLRDDRNSGALPMLRLPGRRDDLEALQPLAARLRDDFDDVVLLGTGGSSLGGQTVAALADYPFSQRKGPHLHFMDNVDPHTIDAMLAALDMTKTAFLVVSKSGGTAETLSQFIACLSTARAAVGEAGLADRFILITQPGDSVLRRMGARWKLPILDHDPAIGGRFSVLSLVGMLPTMVAGVDPFEVRRGAESVLQETLGAHEPGESAPAVGAAISVGLLREHGIGTTVLMPYIDRLGHFGLWYRQLWAESLGKDGKGTTPIRAMGTVDQHSQLQLYLDGPRDKMYSLVTLAADGRGPRVDPALADDPSLDYLAGRTIGDLMAAEQKATGETLYRNGRPTREFALADLDAAAMGALLMHFMLETIIAARLLSVDPFDQPAVEEGKVRAREHLAKIAT